MRFWLHIRVYRVGQKSFVKIQRARAQQRLHVEA
jgi:hypothetical protein